MQTIDVPLRAIAEAEFQAEEAQRAQHEKQERSRIWKERSKYFEALLREMIAIPNDLALTLDPDADVEVDGIRFRLIRKQGMDVLAIADSVGQVQHIASKSQMYRCIHELFPNGPTISEAAGQPAIGKSIQ